MFNIIENNKHIKWNISLIYIYMNNKYINDKSKIFFHIKYINVKVLFVYKLTVKKSTNSKHFLFLLFI